MYAFPNTTEGYTEQPGMSLRDYFAGQAIIGVMSTYAERRVSFEDLADWAYIFADAMLEARGE